MALCNYEFLLLLHLPQRLPLSLRVLQSQWGVIPTTTNSHITASPLWAALQCAHKTPWAILQTPTPCVYLFKHISLPGSASARARQAGGWWFRWWFRWWKPERGSSWDGSLCFCFSCSASPASALPDYPACHRQMLCVLVPNVLIHLILASPGERDPAGH